MLRHFLVLAVLLCLTNCDPNTHPVPNPTTPTDMATASTTPTYCGTNGKHYRHLSDCVDRCVPNEQVFFFCTEKRGRIAYTRQYLMIPQSYGYSLEYTAGSAKCGDVAVSVWSLTSLQPAPTNANVGMMTWSSVESDCSALPMYPAYVEMNLDRLYYVPAGPIDTSVN